DLMGELTTNEIDMWRKNEEVLKEKNNKDIGMKGPRRVQKEQEDIYHEGGKKDK
ncbi:hypothetical protein HPP92_028563, partial [Vanilla planifolia]